MSLMLLINFKIFFVILLSTIISIINCNQNNDKSTSLLGNSHDFMEKRAAHFSSDYITPENLYAIHYDDDDGYNFDKRSQSFVRFGRSADELSKLIEKKEMPGVLRFGKRSDMPGVLRFGKRSDDIPGVLRFGKRDQEKKAVPGVLRFGKRSDMPGVLRFGKRSDDIPGVLRFGKRSDMPGVLRFGKRSDDIPGVLRFGKRFEINLLNKKSDMPGVLRFGRRLKKKN